MNIENITGSGFILLNFNKKQKEWFMFTLIDLNGLYDLPKGTIDSDESILDAAKRELFEETNIDINNENINKTWVDWDYEWQEKKEECLNDIAIFSGESNNLAMFFCEVNDEILNEVKILPNPYTNIKEHLNYKLINLKEFESENTPDYMKNLFIDVLNKIEYYGETRGFYESSENKK